METDEQLLHPKIWRMKNNQMIYTIANWLFVGMDYAQMKFIRKTQNLLN